MLVGTGLAAGNAGQTFVVLEKVPFLALHAAVDITIAAVTVQHVAGMKADILLLVCLNHPEPSLAFLADFSVLSEAVKAVEHIAVLAALSLSAERVKRNVTPKALGRSVAVSAVILTFYANILHQKIAFDARRTYAV